MTHPIPGADAARIALLVQVDELCSQIENSMYAFRGDEEATRQAQGAIDYAKKVAAPYRAAAKVGADVAAEQLDAVYSAAAKVFNVLDIARDGMTFESPRIAPRLLNLRLALVEVERSRLAAGASDRERSPYVLGIKPSNWAEQVAAGAPAETPKPFAYFVQPSGFGPFIECESSQAGCFPAYRAAQPSPAPKSRSE